MRNPSFDRETELQLLQQAPNYSIRELAIQFELSEAVIRNICSRNKIDFKGKRIYRLNMEKEQLPRRSYERIIPDEKKPFIRPKAEYNQTPSPYGIASELLHSK